MSRKKPSRVEVIAHLKSGGSISTNMIPACGMSMDAWLQYAQLPRDMAKRFEARTATVLQLREDGTSDREISAMIKQGAL